MKHINTIYEAVKTLQYAGYKVNRIDLHPEKYLEILESTTHMDDTMLFGGQSMTNPLEGLTHSIGCSV